jgi:diguanylate cyclase (GGDEF)-like protein
MVDEPQELTALITSLHEASSALSERARKLESLVVRGEALRTVLNFVTAPVILDAVSKLILTHALDGGAIGESGSVFVAVPTGERRELQRLTKMVYVPGNRVIEDADVTEYARFIEGEGIAGHVLEIGEAYVATDCAKDKRYKHFSNAPQMRSLMAVPVKYGEQVLGVLCVHTIDRQAEFSEHDQAFVQGLADIASIVVRANYNDQTMLPNLQLMNVLLDREIAEATRSRRPLSMAYLDIDDFGQLNRDHGHAAADEAIKQVAQAMTNETSQWAVLCHCHGDEFAVIFRNQNLAQADAAAGRIRARVEKSPVRVASERKQVTISAGVAEWVPGMDREDLVDRADNANTAAKEAGKNVVKRYEI